MTFLFWSSTMPNIPPLAPTTFVTGANDALAAVDVYDLLSPGVITDIESILAEVISIADALLGSGLFSDTSGSTTGSSSMITGTTVVSVNTGATTSGTLYTAPPTVDPVTMAALLNRIGTASAPLNAAIRSLSPNAQATLVSGLNTTSSTQHQVTLGGMTTTVQSSNYSDIQQLSNLINEFTNDDGQSQVVDLQAIAAVIAGVVKITANLGIPNSFGAITKDIIDVPTLTIAINQCLPTAVQTGDLLSIVSMADKLSSAAITAQYPNLVRTYVSNFNVNYYQMIGSDTSKAFEALTAITTALSEIDPDWNKTVVNGVTLHDVNQVMGASPDFISLIENAAKQSKPDNPEESTSESTGEGLTQTDALAYLFVKEFGYESVWDQLKITYPTIIPTTNEAVSMAIDPSTMLSI